MGLRMQLAVFLVIAVAATGSKYDRTGGMREDQWSFVEKRRGLQDSAKKHSEGGASENAMASGGAEGSRTRLVDALEAENAELRAEAGLDEAANVTAVDEKLSKRMAMLKEINHLLTVQRDKEREVFADRDVVARQAAEMLQDTMRLPFDAEATEKQKQELQLAQAMADALASTPFLTSHARAASKGEYAQIAAGKVGAIEGENEQIRAALEAAGGPAPDDSQELIDRMRDAQQENRKLKAHVELRQQIHDVEEENARLQASLEAPSPRGENAVAAPQASLGAPSPRGENAVAAPQFTKAGDVGVRRGTTATETAGEGARQTPGLSDLNHAYRQVIEGLEKKTT